MDIHERYAIAMKFKEDGDEDGYNRTIENMTGDELLDVKARIMARCSLIEYSALAVGMVLCFVIFIWFASI